MLAAMCRLVQQKAPNKATAVPVPLTAALTGPCDKCDGPHHEDVCPHFKGKSRENHRDATEKYNKKSKAVTARGHSDMVSLEKEESDPYEELKCNDVQVIGQPGDGSCLFHSLSCCLNWARGERKNGHVSYTAGKMRLDIENYIATHPMETIGGTAISDWILWDSQVSVNVYTERMRYGNSWGGAIEIAVCARLLGVVVQVYERKRSDKYTRISRFEACVDGNDDMKDESGVHGILNILYGGRCHYDALQVVLP
jgi:hypothetical protein